MGHDHPYLMWLTPAQRSDVLEGLVKCYLSNVGPVDRAPAKVYSTTRGVRPDCTVKSSHEFHLCVVQGELGWWVYSPLIDQQPPLQFMDEESAMMCFHMMVGQR